MTNIAEQTLASIVTTHHETVPVLEKYHLDFCCKGKRTLQEACSERGIPVNTILDEIKNVERQREPMIIPFAEMNAEQLIRHILIKHHFYVKQSMPAIEEHLNKVAAKHGDRFPYMKEVLQLFTHLKNEMHFHMQKEEIVLFPRIKEMEAWQHFGQKRTVDKNFILAPVMVMEQEHDEAGTILEQIRNLTSDYSIPEGACTTFKVVLQELRSFEEDLHQHVHLENNLLFPMAGKMLQDLN